METSAYVSVSGQLALERRLSTVANNVANAGTVGFRAEGVHFSAVVSSTEPFRTSFASEGGTHADLQSGGLVKTGSPLDVAIQGDAFMAIQTPQGVAYTRDGRMQMLPGGDLVTLNGHPVLDISGSPLSLDPRSADVQISRDGMIRQNGRAIGALGLFNVDFSSGYARYENAAFLPRTPGQPADETAGNGVIQGFVEESNVNPVLAMTQLITVQRIFEAVSAAMEQRDSTLHDTIQALGARGS